MLISVDTHSKVFHMKFARLLVFLFSLMLIVGCNFSPDKNYSIEVEALGLGLKTNFRGLSVVDTSTIWVSGTGGTYIVSVDGGASWKIDSIEGAGMLDFRSIYAFDNEQAILVSAGTPARIYKTNDGGTTWTLNYSSDNPAIFFDAVSFWNENDGLVMGDPVDGKIFLLKTEDGGETWNKIAPENIPPSLLAEGGFAASGTCLITEGDHHAWIGVGGDSARVYRTTDQGINWSVHQTPILHGGQMKGIYSLAFKSGQLGIVVGGEWNVKSPTKSRAFTIDGGLNWELGSGVDSYCSGSCYVKDDIYLACGQSGIDISVDGGRSWKNISDLHLYGIRFDESGNVGFGSGPGGKVVKLRLVQKQ
jgi:photosystem II stability/assembly factor-like uncharacterized protein